jgi:hypothetical protein
LFFFFFPRWKQRGGWPSWWFRQPAAGDPAVVEQRGSYAVVRCTCGHPQHGLWLSVALWPREPGRTAMASPRQQRGGTAWRALAAAEGRESPRGPARARGVARPSPGWPEAV